MNGVRYLSCLACLLGALPASSMVLSLVTDGADKPALLVHRQAVGKSAYGGWVVTAWPAGLRVGGEAVLGYRTASQALLDTSMQRGLEGTASGLDGLVRDMLDDDEAEDLDDSQPVRPSEARLSLRAGDHELAPFGIGFTTGPDGRVSRVEPRARIVREGRGVEVPCHPVTFRTLREGRTIAAALRVTLGQHDLLGGLAGMLADWESRDVTGLPEEPPDRFFRLILYLPASAPGAPYAINGKRFHVSGDGRVELLDAGPDSRQAGPATLAWLAGAAPPRSPARTVGVRWLGADPSGGVLSIGDREIVMAVPEGSARVALDGGGAQALRAGAWVGAIPAHERDWPVGLLLWDAREPAGWWVETQSLMHAPGADFTCRLRVVKGPPLDGGQALEVALEAEPGGDAGGSMRLRAVGGDVWVGGLPEVPGLWRLRVVSDGVLSGQILGLVRIVTPGTQALVSIYPAGNRGLFRRGDPVDLLWVLDGLQDAPVLPDTVEVVLRGPGVQVSRTVVLSGQSGGARRSGRLVLRTDDLAPGAYTVALAGNGLEGEAGQFRIVQREPLSTYELYSHVFGMSAPYGGSPVSAYHHAVPGGAGLSPLLGDGNAALDAAWAIYAGLPGGVLPERLAEPSDDALALMALAGQGMRAVLDYPTMLHAEAWNPKHTLPEELQRMRRRLGLFVQTLADVAGFGGLSLGWYAAPDGYWEDTVPLDGHQAKRNAAAAAWVQARVASAVERVREAGLAGAQLERFARRMAVRFRSSILPQAFDAYLVDALHVRPELSVHNAIPSWWLGRDHGYAPYAYAGLTQRDAVDYSDYGLTAWGNFRTPAWMRMGNRDGQRLFVNFMANQLHNRIVTSFGATGRGISGISMPVAGGYPQGQDEALLRIFERFGSWFAALPPLPDVAVYNSDTNPQNVVLHDLARMRRPGMLLGWEDVLAGALSEYRVLVLVNVGEGEPDAVLRAFRAFEAGGGIILKDRGTHASLPGRDLGFAYAGDQVHGVWGLAYANGEDEFAHLWRHFKATREPLLEAAFREIPGLPVTTTDPDVVISPLAGEASILCFVLNQTLVPTRVPGRWRQYFVLPRAVDLLVEDGWHVHNVLTGQVAEMAPVPGGGQRTAVDLTRMEGAVYLLTRQRPSGMAMQSERLASGPLRLTAWLADDAGGRLPDPMPFEVTLRGPDGTVVFRRFAALGPEHPLDVPVPLATDGRAWTLTVRDLVLGTEAQQQLAAAPSGMLEIADGPDWVGGEAPVRAFLAGREGPVTILLEEGQTHYRTAADQLADLLRKHGREARIVAWDPADVRLLPLRWQPTEADERIVSGLAGGRGFASRVGLRGVAETDPRTGRTIRMLFEDPACGYTEYGPRLRHDADIVLFGSTMDNRALAELEPYLRRVPSAHYPAAGGFFVQHVWSAFTGGYHALHIGCRDAGGAEAAIEALARLLPVESEPEAGPAGPVASAPVVTRGGEPRGAGNSVAGRIGRPILDVAFAPGGERLFVSIRQYGPQLFLVSRDGRVLEQRDVQHHDGNLYRGIQGRMRAVDDDGVWIDVGGTRYLYRFSRGWERKASVPDTGFSGRGAALARAATVLEAPAEGRVYLGGARRMQALDGEGRPVWTYDDLSVRHGTDDLLYPRSLFPRALSDDGRVLLVAGFGVEERAHGPWRLVNATLQGLDTATGQVLWQRELLVNEGETLPFGDRFLVVDDTGDIHVIRALDGRDAGRLPPVGRTGVRVLPIAGARALLVVENDAFDRDGPTVRAYLRPLDGGNDRSLPIAGRVTDMAVRGDGDGFVLASARGLTYAFDAAGDLLWTAEVPSGGIVRVAPEADEILVGADDGTLYWLDAADGRHLRHLDFNPFNLTTAEAFVEQLGSRGEVLPDRAMTPQPAEPEPAYRDVLDPERVGFGPNLVDQAQLASALRPGAGRNVGRLDPGARFRLAVEAGQTYLVEVLAAAVDMDRLTPYARLEIAVRGAPAGANLPFTARLPLGGDLARRRVAFRADVSGDVELTLRAVQPRHVTERGRTVWTYEQADLSEAGVRVADLYVGAIGFQGRNLLFDGGPDGRSVVPAGAFTCEVVPWTGGSHLVRTAPYPAPQAALRIVNGVIANAETAWTTEATGRSVSHARGLVRFREPQRLSTIAVYEDNRGPVVQADGVVREMASTRFGVYVREAESGNWHTVGAVAGNTQLVNLFVCPDVPVSEILYFRAGRTDAEWTDGVVRVAEIEAYAADDLDALLQDALDTDGAGLPGMGW